MQTDQVRLAATTSAKDYTCAYQLGLAPPLLQKLVSGQQLPRVLHRPISVCFERVSSRSICFRWGSSIASRRHCVSCNTCFLKLSAALPKWLQILFLRRVNPEVACCSLRAELGSLLHIATMDYSRASFALQAVELPPHTRLEIV